MKSPSSALPAVFCALLFSVAVAAGQTDGRTNAPIAGELGGLAQVALKLDLDDQLPPKLCALLWPGSGANGPKRDVKKLPLQEKDVARLFCLRPDNHDIVLMRRTETQPVAGAKTRTDFYYRTDPRGGLALALKATFAFALDELDEQQLKKVTWETYGAATGDGTKPLPVTPEITAQFAAEKKYWLAQEKKLKKLKRPPKQ